MDILRSRQFTSSYDNPFLMKSEKRGYFSFALPEKTLRESAMFVSRCEAYVNKSHWQLGYESCRAIFKENELLNMVYY